MYNFFVKSENKSRNGFTIVDKDFNHIKNVLRMKTGDKILVTCDDKSALCKIVEISCDAVITEIIEDNYQDTSLPVEIYLFQGLPKSDKMELIIQKAVELGVHAIVPVQTIRSVVKLDEKKKDSKCTRWQAISESAAKQSKRNSIPEVKKVMSFDNAIEFAKTMDIFLIPYENALGMTKTKNALTQIKSGMKIGVFIGAEGGFEEREIEKVLSINGKVISLGKRILRAETASITALSMLMLYCEMNLE